jgi:hypothetical protein
MVTKLWTMVGWVQGEEISLTISFGWGQNDWDTTLHNGPPFALFMFLLSCCH